MKLNICKRLMVLAIVVALVFPNFVLTARANPALATSKSVVGANDSQQDEDEDESYELEFQKYYIDADDDGNNGDNGDNGNNNNNNNGDSSSQDLGILGLTPTLYSLVSDVLLLDLLGLDYLDSVVDDVITETWGQINSRLTEAQSYATGKNVTVAVLDTGLWPDHDLISKSPVAGYDFIDNDNDPKDELNGIDDNNNGAIDEGAGHGTHVSYIILSGAPDINLMPIRILNSDGRGTPEVAATAIRYAVDNGADVINLSLSGSFDSPELASAVQYAQEQDVLLVAAASSRTQGRLDFPAAYDGVISVGSINASNEIPGYVKPYASSVDVFAPGSIIYGAYHSNSYAWVGGNSMATAFVSATAALLLQNPECNAECARTAILASGSQLPDESSGAKRIDAVSAIVRASDQLPGAKPQGLALRCDGVNDLVQGRSIPSFVPFTAEFWVNMSDVESEQILFAQTGLFNSLFLYSRNNKLQLASYALFSSAKIVHDEPLVANQWSHVAIVYDGRSKMKLFVDGQLAGNVRKKSSLNGSRLELCGHSYGSHNFAGLIDDFHITLRAKYGDSFEKPTGSLEADSRSLLLWTMEDIDDKYLTDMAKGYNRGTLRNFDDKQPRLWPVALLDPLINAAAFSGQESLVLEDLIPTEPEPQIMLPFIIMGQ